MIAPMPLDMLMTMKGNYNLRIETEVFSEFIGTEYSLEVIKWVNCLKGAEKNSHEAARTTLGKIERNVSDLQEMFRMKQGTEIKSKIDAEFKKIRGSTAIKKIDSDTFLEIATNIYNHIHKVRV